MIRVLIADDQRVVRDGLAMVLKFLPDVDVVGAASDGEQAVEQAVRLSPDVVLMDLRMPRCGGIEATRRLRGHSAAIKVIALTTYDDERSVLDALRAGARGYLTKGADATEIQRALRQIAGGRAVIDPAVQHHLVEAIAGQQQPERAPTPDGLTPREVDVLSLVAEGLSNIEIAQRLVVSEATVKSHINHLLSKSGARDRAQAVGYAYRHGFVRHSR